MLAVVWRRIDFRESSRLVTLVSRERGRFVALVKGAHRPGSAHLGRLDFLNQCEVEIAGRGVPLLGRTRLVHEPRALREGPRYLVATHTAELLDRVLVPDRPDPELFDLLVGGITLLERMPVERLPVAILGLELRLLRALGVLGTVDACIGCGDTDAPYVDATEAGRTCARHRAPHARRASDGAIAWLREIGGNPGRTWPQRVPDRGLPEALAITERWIEHALEFRPAHRRHALAACAGARVSG